MSVIRTTFVALFLLSIVFSAGAQVTLDPKLPIYKPISGVSGAIKSVGSDTMNNLMTLWSEEFRKFYPNVTVEIEGKGSSTAPVALISGSANFGPMSRAIKSTEADKFESKFGYKPIQLGTSLDVLAVYTNKDNPIEGLTLNQLDAIFSKNRLGGLANDIKVWGEVGLKGNWANKTISMYGRNSASGTYGYFKQHALFGGDYKDSVKEQPGSSAVIQSVASDRYGIGYSGIGYKTADVKAISVGRDENSLKLPNMQNAYNGDYPLSRFLYLTVNYEPGTQLDPLRKEFLKFIYSKQGQSIVIEDGYFPVTAPVAIRQLGMVGIK
jgi:phosphate transport system substrate-binding protein